MYITVPVAQLNAVFARAIYQFRGQLFTTVPYAATCHGLAPTTPDYLHSHLAHVKRRRYILGHERKLTRGRTTMDLNGSSNLLVYLQDPGLFDGSCSDDDAPSGFKGAWPLKDPGLGEKAA